MELDDLTDTIVDAIPHANRSNIYRTLKGAKVIPIVKENNFNYKYIPIKEIMRKDVHKDIIEIVEKNKPKG